MAGEPELDDAVDAIPLGLASVDLNGVGYMNDSFTATLAATITSERFPVAWEFDYTYTEKVTETDKNVALILKKKKVNEEEEDDVEYGSAVSEAANVVAFTVKMNRYGRYAFVGLTSDPNDDRSFAHGFGVKMSPMGLSHASGSLFAKNKFDPMNDQICVALRKGQVDACKNGRQLEVLGEVPDGCVSMYAKIFIREPDFILQVMDTATCCKVSAISLSGNKIGDAGAASLAQVLEKDTNLVTTLDLSLNRIADAGAERLSQALVAENCRVTRLNLAHNTVGDDGASALAVALENGDCRVMDLDLTDNDVADAGAIRLADAFCEKTCSVIRMGLALNRIESAGFMALAEALERRACKIKDITLGQNKPDKAARRRMAQAYAKTVRLNVA